MRTDKTYANEHITNLNDRNMPVWCPRWSRVSIKSDLVGVAIDTLNLNIMLFDIKATKFDFNSGKNIYKNITVIQNKLVIYH